jgi:hypothetical protein
LDEVFKEMLNQTIETNHYAFDSKILARFSVKQVERLKIKFNDRIKMKDFTFLGISTNAKGIGMSTYD